MGYDYTGPDLAKLSDKRVGIIGTGAAAIQCVPHLARSAEHLLVFQRTPSTVDVRGNRPTDPGWSADLADGWQRRRIENFQLLTAGGEAEEDLVNDAWTSIVKKLFMMRQTRVVGMSDEERLRTADLADFAKMEEIRARVDSIVTDRDTAEALKPWDGYFFKRPGFTDQYLQTFNRHNVTLIDTQGRVQHEELREPTGRDTEIDARIQTPTIVLHAVAALGTRLRTGDVAFTATG